MSNWIATTESGRTYTSKGSGILVSGDGYYHNPVIRVVDRNEVSSWDDLLALPLVDEPVVGKSLFILTYGDSGWRLSTDIVSVEHVADEEQ